MKKSKIILLLLLMMIPSFVKAEGNLLYDVLKNEAESNGLAREYTGQHKDSMNPSLSTENIYYWYDEAVSNPEIKSSVKILLYLQ